MATITTRAGKGSALTHSEMDSNFNNLNNGGTFAAGTKIVFYQAAAPTGWTQDTTKNNFMLRSVSTAGGGSGGTISPIDMSHLHTTQAHTLTIAEMPAHDHPSSADDTGQTGRALGSSFVARNGSSTGSTGGGGSHTHNDTGTATITPFHIDVILASKD